MPSKPFIAARIPELLNERLDSFVQETGSSRTQILVNALAAYLGISIEIPEHTRAVDRLADLEKRVAYLEGIIRQPVQGSIFDNKEVISNDKKSGIEEVKLDNHVDNKPKNNVIKTTKEVCELIGWTRSKLDSYMRRGLLPITERGYIVDQVGQESKPHGKLLWKVEKDELRD